MTGDQAGPGAWAARRLREVLERDGDPDRVRRGRVYAEQGAVSRLKTQPGEVTARVAGSRSVSYRVGLITALPGAEEWQTLARALGSQPVFRAALLAGGFPPELERVFEVVGLRLLPGGLGDVVVSCSCPDWGDPCKHAAAALFVLARTLESDPLLLVEWLGRPRRELLADVRRAARSPAESADAAAALAEPEAPGVAEPDPSGGGPAGFWRAPHLPDPPRLDGAPPAVAIAGPPPAADDPDPADPGGDDPAELLAPLYQRLVRPGGPDARE
ncbi:SWIM zinc finger family protein [Streptomonospora salina]|uniref:Putative Zn finger protein n=1 Tax=Streptomonospora salina TaxID=104205 RepID=A0A841ECZ4_9ACTN|nr:SWIM zinc finger family protein [Streptomonospora salina]MBB6000992.1 putative Zn finger protein [Streptomonospora salina]